MSIIKDLYIQAYEELHAEMEEVGLSINESKLGDMAYNRSIDRFAAMCDEAKDRRKYEQTR